MMSLKTPFRLLHQYLYILQLVILTMSLEINIRLVSYSRGGVLWEFTDFFSGMADNLGNQILDDNCRFNPIFCCNNFHWQNRGFLCLGSKDRQFPVWLKVLSLFKFFCQIIIFGDSFIFPVPVFTLPSMKLLLASRAACSLPAFLPYIRNKPFSANRARAFSTIIFCHHFSPRFKSRRLYVANFE